MGANCGDLLNEGRCVELVHIRYCKSILGVKRNTPNDMVRSELDRTYLRCRRLYNMYTLIGIYMLHLTSSDQIVKVVP